MSSVRKIKMGNMVAAQVELDNGDVVVNACEALHSYPKTILEKLEYWANEKPDKIFLAERYKSKNDSWNEITYEQTWTKIKKIASGLSKKNLSVDKPIAILSGNSIDHALLGLAAMYIGIPYAAISPQYALISKDFSKLKHCLDLITPGLIYVDNGSLYENAITSVVDESVEVLVSWSPLSSRSSDLLESLIENSEDNDEVAKRYDAIKADDPAKFLFSSGSTGMPKAVVNTHRMLAANQQMILQALPSLAEPSPVLVDWLPWNHTFGGNHNFGIVLYNGGTLYIDDGKPTPNGFKKSIRNLKEIAPTAFYNVPKGFDELVKHLRKDKQLREKFFSQVKILFYAGAGLSQPVWDALEELAIETCGERIMIVTGLGCTETAPSALFTTGDNGFAGWLGLPVAGVEAKLVKTGTKTEIRFRGDSVSPGYWRQPELTEKAFDEEGYFKTGDAIKLVDENDLQKGFRFDGRISEDFKLDTGTWVSAGPLRGQFLDHFGSLVKDVVIVGRDRPFVSALVFPDMDSCRQLDSSLEGMTERELVENKKVQKIFLEKLTAFASKATGSASRIRKLSLQSEPPSLDGHEITDKGSLNAGAIQDNRASEIESLYGDEKKSHEISDV
ncbi:MAG: feruloyl-CoA synthase [Cellvibrionaceae bacterium]